LKERNRKRVLVHGEILYGQNFEYNNLYDGWKCSLCINISSFRYIEYFLDLPPGWTCDSKNESAISHISSTRNSIAHFGFPFEFTLEAPQESMSRLFLL
jgi:hypothetical protein